MGRVDEERGEEVDQGDDRRRPAGRQVEVEDDPWEDHVPGRRSQEDGRIWREAGHDRRLEDESVSCAWLHDHVTGPR